MISTHKMLRDAGKDNNAKFSTADSVGPCVHMYFPCTETFGADTGIVDIANNYEMVKANILAMATGSESGNNVSINSWTDNTGDALDAALPDYSNADVLIVICAKAQEDVGNSDADNGGNISLYITGNDGSLVLQPYYVRFSVGTDDFATPWQDDYRVRTVGTAYVFAGAKRTGDQTLEHYADGVLTGTTENRYALTPSAFKTAWNAFDATDNSYIYSGHSSYVDVRTCIASTGLPLCGLQVDCSADVALLPYLYDRSNGDIESPTTFCLTTGNTSSVTEEPNDVYFIQVFTFPLGEMPTQSEIAEATLWMKTEAIAGRKSIWPAWVSLAGGLQ